ncbi:MAG TPA: tRNA preQ1(34) S-adenosylmethionine ribosyltransferase-isomerase QueA, partial [Clostridiales bacterium]|nr:tRNA preQ1(34) S-adenosylmethionine ribosyltransferase-isomerase QueA [Clostridiales bacterium]
AFLGIENTLNMYNTAVKEKYRFYSFGDATLLI